MTQTHNKILTLFLVLHTSLLFFVAAMPAYAEETGSSLTEAYKKEFAFLEMQKRDLGARVKSFKAEAEWKKNQLEQVIDRLSDREIELENEVHLLKKQIEEAERAVATKQDHDSLLSGTLEQGFLTLGENGRKIAEENLAELTSAEQTGLLFENVGPLLESMNELRREQGQFYLTDGSRVAGEIVQIGSIAAFGISSKESGALAPAGDGEFKIWQDSLQTEPVTADRLPDELNLFLYESLHKDVKTDGQQTLIEYLNDGGVIGWIIVMLGALAALLLIVRSVLLKFATGNTGYILKHVTGLVMEGKVSDAVAACNKRKGCAAKVVVATLNNIDQEKEQLEDIISESILAESSGLERFSTMILVIASVAPLLGLLGTVTGMISTFDVITEFGTGDPKMLSGGIATALITTQLGLVVAIPTLLCGSLLTAWGNRIKNDMERIALHILTRYQLGQE